MNYRHGYHAGNFADLAKHAAVLALLRAMRDGGPLLVVDTHAGAGAYDLSDAAFARSKEAEAGVQTLLAGDAPDSLGPLADYHVDALPWAATSPGIALAAGDGAYDSSHESAVGEIPTSHLTPGRHFVYVQATDTDGHAGTPNAVFFDVNGPTDRIFADGFEGAR